MKPAAGMFGWFTAMKLGTKLLLAFFAVLLMTLVLGFFSIYSLGQVNLVSSDLANKWMPRVGHTTTMRAAMLEVREFEVKHARAADVGYMEEYEEKMKAALEVIAGNSRDFEALLANDEERQLYGEFQKAWAEYLKFNQKVIALGRANQQDDAKDIGEGAAKSASDDAIMAVDKMTAQSFEGGKAHAEQAANVFNRARLWSFTLLGGAVLIGILLALGITRSLLRQLGGEPAFAVGITQRIASGDLSVEIRLANGDQDSLLHAIKSMRDNFAGIVGRVRHGSENVAAASAEIASGNSDLSARTESQASSLEETAASMEELGSTVRHNADNARQANQLAQSASSVAIKGGEVVSQVVDTMKEINDSSKRIADIISVIDGIAFQTNILALNAAVEAARAGEQGRGFAVVAGEVRSLAGRSAEAAKEIKALITASVDRVAQGTALVDQAGSTMEEVVASIRRVTDIMGEISAASTEQSQGVAQVSEAVGQMDQVTQQNAALVEEMAASAASLRSQAQELVQAVAVFKLMHEGQPVHARPAPVQPVAAARVSRPVVTASKAAASPAKPAAKLSAPAPAPAKKDEAEGDWETF